MKAACYDSYGLPEVMVVREVPKPSLGSDEIIVKVHAAAVTMGDCEMRSPKIPNFTWFLFPLYFGIRKPKYNILGSYLSGEVVGVGENVKTFREGNRVFGMSVKFGAHASYICMAEKSPVTILNDLITFKEAAPLALALESLHFLKKAGIKKGENVLINGAGGGIGSYAVQLAIYLGAKVTAADSANKLEMLSSLGAERVIDYTLEDFSKCTGAYDIIFDVVGALSFRQRLRMLTKNGRYISAIPLISDLPLYLWTKLFSHKKNNDRPDYSSQRRSGFSSGPDGGQSTKIHDRQNLPFGRNKGGT